MAIARGEFDDILDANRTFAEGFSHGELTNQAAREVAILTCMDCRIEPYQALGLAPGDAKVVRNAGARLTDDALRSLTLATHLLGVTRIMVIAHTNCAMADTTDEELLAQVPSPAAVEVLREAPLLTTTDQLAALRSDVAQLRASPALAEGVVVAGFMYDVTSGLVEHVEA